MPKLLCLNMIVRNESARIIRALESVAPHIAAWVICDTGSTDDTKAVIEKFFAEKKIPGMMVSCEFKDFSQARNIALTCARHFPLPYDYILLMDADMQLRVSHPAWLEMVQGDSFDMYQQSGSIKYQNRRLVKAGTEGVYLGATHEFLNVNSGGCIPAAVADFYDHADGANRPDKFKRDIRLLKADLAKDPNNVRSMYYLAQSYSDANKPDKAAKWYQRRMEAGGWDEEVWSAQCCLAEQLLKLKDDAAFVRNLQLAYNRRPSRVEPLVRLAKYHREKGESHLSVLFSEPAMSVPMTGDALFVDEYSYECGGADEFSISAFYIPEKKKKGFEICNQQTLKKGNWGYSRELARSNMYFYLPSLAESCPSFMWQKIDFTPEEGWVALNPSVCNHMGNLMTTIRTVNYKIDEHGRYLIRGTDGTANATNPINTRNFLAQLDGLNVKWVREILPPGNKPAPLFDLVVGLEDMRAYSWQHKLYASACIRENTPEGWCEQVNVEIMPDFHTDNMTRMIKRPRAHEKNWMPIVCNPLLGRMWLYRLDERVDVSGQTVGKNPCDKWDVGSLAGGSQVIAFGNGYLCVVHEACNIPQQPTRFYSHRFVWLDESFTVRKITPPFYLNEKGVEYVSGLAWAPGGIDTLVLSYGFKDCEARIATVSQGDITKMLGL